MELLHGQAVDGCRLAHLNLEAGAGPESFNPAVFLESSQAQAGGLVEGFRLDLNAVCDAR